MPPGTGQQPLHCCRNGTLPHCPRLNWHSVAPRKPASDKRLDSLSVSYCAAVIPMWNMPCSEEEELIAGSREFVRL
ncbi:hypothetical protein MHYP_G00037180 [Metynnis hypsauchen]